MNAPVPAHVTEIEFELDGQRLRAHTGQTILEAARAAGVAIPHLCYTPGMRPDGNCRACMVEIEGERVLAASCCRTARAGMKVHAGNDRARSAQRMVLELLLSDVSLEARQHEASELVYWARSLKAQPDRFQPRPQPLADLSHPAIAVRLDACIQCTRCVRACREVQVNDVIGMALRGEHAKISFDIDDPMGDSTCVGCGECVQACPTGALLPAGQLAAQAADRTVDSVCPYCGVGCQLTYHISDERIVKVEGRQGPANQGRLCVKGRYGFDYVHHPHRLTRPLIRRTDAPKHKDAAIEPGNWQSVFREATWEEALSVAAAGLLRVRDRAPAPGRGGGPSALAGFGSAKGSNEEAYLFQKLVRTGFGSNNVDHCTRLCHASSVAALMEGVNSGAVSNPVNDVAHADVIFVIGANPTVNHPVAATWIKNAVRRGATLIVADPRRTELARHAKHVLQFRPDTDVALLNAMLHVIVTENRVNEDFVRDRTSGFEALRDRVRAYSPENMAPVCGIDAQTIRTVARAYADSPASMILWGMGVSQHVHGTDNARCLIALAMVTGQIGRPGTGLHPLRGQNNVQGASDSGLIPMVFPDYQRVDNPTARARFEAAWKTPLDPRPGLTVVEIIDAARRGDIRAMYVMGENPAMSDPDTDHAREALASLEHLVVQDIFLTETAWFADVVLPASAWPEKDGTATNTDRMVQLGRQALEPPGQARADLWIINALACQLGLDWQYQHPRDVFKEMRTVMDSIAGITWERLERESSVTYPCVSEGEPGEPIIFKDRFPTADGRAKLVPADLIAADEQPDDQYPLVLITGRQLEHWHTGAMTRRAGVLDAIEPEPTATMHPLTIDALGTREGELVTVSSRRGSISLYARADAGTPRDAVFIPFCYYEAAANRLTNPALDPIGKIPEFKYCAVRVVPGGTPPQRLSYGGGQAAQHLTESA
jgi:formate dehydrogenase major subunit